ncbi:MAG: hypothetical protein ACYDH2_10745 [Anaerolineaceae bacterium]
MKQVMISIIIMVFMITACSPQTATPTQGLELIPSVELTELIPTLASTPTLSHTVAETEVVTPETNLDIPVDYSAATYLDDRSTPATLLYSLANAINRHEFIRAYSYWSSPMDYLGILDAFTNNYANTSSVEVNIGDILSEGAAGSIYYSAPVIFTFTNSDTTVYRLSSCFLFRFPQPANFGEPPIDLLHISKGGLNSVPADINDSDAMSSACNGTDYGTVAAGNPPESHNLENLVNQNPDNYIDNRSGAVEVVSSLFNAINRKEYVRAFSYWQDPAAVGNYADYAAGFADTDLITATFGSVISDAGAGQYYYQVPVTQTVQTTGGTIKIFVGCYTLHLANPGMQATMPFEPLGITSGKFALVANDLDTTGLMERACN